MSFISFDFLIFTAGLTALYYLVPMKLRPPLLLLASALFYAMADLRFFIFLGISIISCYAAGLAMEKLPERKKLWLGLGIVLNLGLLLAVKYLGFAGDILARLTGVELRLPSLLLPLGISFYTLQAIGYLMDVYRGDVRAQRSLWRFALFMGYFPIIVQGPISRYSQLAPQLFEPRRFDFERIKSGLQLMLWGFFKKLIIADRAAMLAEQVFRNYTEYSGLAVLVGLLVYILQLYADFSGCVDICRGCAELVGVKLMENFRRPFLSCSVRELWRRWHISLSSWFRDYVYIPLGGSRRGALRKHINVFIIFTLSGLWHGAGLNYICWGAMQGLFIVAEELGEKLWRRLRGDRPLLGEGPVKTLLGRLYCFAMFAFSVLFFRAPGLRAGLSMLVSIVQGPWLSQLTDGTLLTLGLGGAELAVLCLGLLVFIAASLIQERREALGLGGMRQLIAGFPLPLRWALWLGGVMAVLIFGIYGPGYSSAAFIYMGF